LKNTLFITILNLRHLKAQGNWINDPNGFIYYKGKYHLFYQYFPYAPVWGTMHWGHAVSEDLVHWEHVGIALFPTRSEDRNGCFSGSAVEHEGRMHLYYTGIHHCKINAENIHVNEGDYEASQLTISSEDGYSFDNFGGKRVAVPVIRDGEMGDHKDTRDPKVWKEGDTFYMVLGSTYRGEVGRALFYRSEDGVNWQYASQYRSERFGRILECPDIFRMGDSYIFIGSPMYIEQEAGGYEHHAVCMPADFEPETCSLSLHGNYQYIDYGLDLYAPQTNVDADGRRVMIAWMRMPKAVEEPEGAPWNGIMCLPRVIEIEGGHVYFRVHPEVERYFGKEVLGKETVFAGGEDMTGILDGDGFCESGVLSKENDGVPGIGDGRGADRPGILNGEPCRVQVTLKDGESIDIGGFKIRAERDFIRTDRSSVFGGIEGHRLVSSTPKLYGRYKLDIFVEPNLIEVFINDGEYVISNVVYGLGQYISGRAEKIFAGK